ncbi:MAG TPA: SgcJ/EcaC family oxidoreductase [Candidatus Sulfotelmatobacter sp.]
MTDSEEPTASIGPYNPALGEIYQQLYPEIKRPKPNQEAIAAALKAMQRLTMRMDSEAAVEETTQAASVACPSCGHPNREGNKFCGTCGLSIAGANAQSNGSERRNSGATMSLDLEREERVSQVPFEEQLQEFRPPENLPPGTHHYHHHYHYFPGGGAEMSAAAPRGGSEESAREADRMRIAAAAKGEPMSRHEAAVRRITQEWVLACNTRQLDELLDLYAPDALVLRSNMPVLRGAAAVREFFHSALESGLGEVALEPIRVEVTGDLAHEVGRYSALVPGTIGKRREERGKYLWVFGRQNGGEWKLISECWSADLTLSTNESDLPKTGVTTGAKGQPRK